VLISEGASADTDRLTCIMAIKWLLLFTDCTPQTSLWSVQPLFHSSPRWRLRSSTGRSCVVPHTHNTFSDRSFAIAGPRIWNSPSTSTRWRHYIQQFKAWTQSVLVL